MPGVAHAEIVEGGQAGVAAGGEQQTEGEPRARSGAAASRSPAAARIAAAPGSPTRARPRSAPPSPRARRGGSCRPPPPSAGWRVPASGPRRRGARRERTAAQRSTTTPLLARMRSRRKNGQRAGKLAGAGASGKRRSSGAMLFGAGRHSFRSPSSSVPQCSGLAADSTSSKRVAWRWRSTPRNPRCVATTRSTRPSISTSTSIAPRGSRPNTARSCSRAARTGWRDSKALPKMLAVGAQADPGNAVIAGRLGEEFPLIEEATDAMAGVDLLEAQGHRHRARRSPRRCARDRGGGRRRRSYARCRSRRSARCRTRRRRAPPSPPPFPIPARSLPKPCLTGNAACRTA